MELAIRPPSYSDTKKHQQPAIDQDKQLALAMTLKKEGSDLEAFNIFKNLADKYNNAEAQFEVANMYFEGNDAVKKNEEKATAYYSQAASQGHAAAQNSYARAFNYGHGVPKNETLAFSWFLESANQGNAKAKYNLGVCYLKGWGIQRNISPAIFWFTEAAKQNFAVAQNTLGLLYFEGDLISEDIPKAHELFKSSADQGNAEGQFLLGWVHRYCFGTDKDSNIALDLFKKAADQGHKRAGKEYEKLRPMSFKEYWDSLVSGLGFAGDEKTEELCELTELS